MWRLVACATLRFYTVRVGRPYRLRQPKTERLREASWYLSHGYPQTIIAELMGMHVNTIQHYAKVLGYVRPRGFTGLAEAENRCLNSLLRRARALTPEARRMLLERLNKEAADGHPW